jgi:serine protease
MPFSNSLLRLAGTFLLAATFLTTATAAELRFAKDPIPGQYIVVLKDEAASLAHEPAAQRGPGSQRGNAASMRPEVPQVAQQMSRAYRAEVRQTFGHVLRGFVVRANEQAIARILEDDRVAFVEEDGIVTLSQTTQPNATWGLDRVDQRDLPLDGTYTYDTTASNVHTYIIDTGVRASHNDFGGRVTSGFSSINDGRGSDDCNGHGTHVAGTVAGATWGVAKGAVIHPVRVLNCQGSGTNSGVIAGMDWVAANASFPAVANMSLGGGASTATDNAVTNMRNAGVTVVVAAGNENQDACNVSPARSGNAITVGSTTSNDSRSSFSNWGSCVDIFAPGSDITAAWHTSNTATNTISGTSMAAPHVAGIAALYLAENTAASPAQVENAIYDNATQGRLSGIGSGSPNLLAYSRFGDGGGDDGGGDDGSGELENGEAVTNLSGNQGSETFFSIEVPAGAENLEISISGGTGDADLYVRHGAEPTQSTYDCRPYLNGNNETCTESEPQAGTWHIMIHGWQAYSGVTLIASYDEPAGGGPGEGELQNGVALTGLSAPTGSETHYFIEVPAGASNLEISTSGGSGDVDLYVRYGAEPTQSNYDCRPYRWGNEETCTFDDPAAGTWYVMLHAYEGYSNLTLEASFEESGGGDGAPCSNCDLYTGSLSGTGNAQVQPNGTYYQAGAGTHNAWLEGPSNADFDLELYRWNGSSWTRVASATTPDSSEHISYQGTAGFYYWRVLSYSGSGSYELWLDTP